MPYRPRRISTAVVLTAALTGVGIVTGQAALGSAPPGLVPGSAVVTAPPSTGGVSASPTPSPAPSAALSPPTDVVVVAHATSLIVSWTAPQHGQVDHYVVVPEVPFTDVR